MDTIGYSGDDIIYIGEVIGYSLVVAWYVIAKRRK